MRLRSPLLVVLALMVFGVPARSGRLRTDAGPPPPLTGRVISAEEGAMEGVLVSARRAGSTITTTVVTNRRGEYRVPPGRLEPGRYALRIGVAGFALEGRESAAFASKSPV